MIPETANFEKLKETKETLEKNNLTLEEKQFSFHVTFQKADIKCYTFDTSAVSQTSHFSFRMKLSFRIQLRLNERERYDIPCSADRVSR